MGIRKNATIIKKLAYDISAVAENCKSQQKKIFFCRQSRLRLIWKSEFLLQAANGQNPRKETLGYQHDSKAFLFSLVNKPGWAPVKLPQKGKYSSRKNSIQNLKSLGPSFGEHDMQLSSLASKNRNSVCSATLATRTAHQVGTNIKPHLRSNSLQDYLFQSK